jgi:hypothetical protein
MPSPREIALQKNNKANFDDAVVEQAAKGSTLPAAPTYDINVSNPPAGPAPASGLKR